MAGKNAKNPLLDLDDPTATSPTAPPSATAGDLFEEVRFRERMPTITDEVALEQARLASMQSLAPRPKSVEEPSRQAPRAPEPAPSPPPQARAPMPPLGVPPVRGRVSSVEILAGEEELDELKGDEQIAILRARLAPLHRVPRLARGLAELGSLVADPKTAYVLGFVDGVLPLDTIIDVTGLPEIETLRVLDKVAAQGLFVWGFA